MTVSRRIKMKITTRSWRKRRYFAVQVNGDVFSLPVCVCYCSFLRGEVLLVFVSQNIFSELVKRFIRQNAAPLRAVRTQTRRQTCVLVLRWLQLYWVRSEQVLHQDTNRTTGKQVNWMYNIFHEDSAQPFVARLSSANGWQLCCYCHYPVLCFWFCPFNPSPRLS